jgi:hypothetical protein
LIVVDFIMIKSMAGFSQCRVSRHVGIDINGLVRPHGVSGDPGRDVISFFIVYNPVVVRYCDVIR